MTETLFWMRIPFAVLLLAVTVLMAWIAWRRTE